VPPPIPDKHLLTIETIRGNGSYFTDLARANYYDQGGEPPGFWIGEGADFMGLNGKSVSKEKLRNILNGFDPENGKTQLVQNAGKTNRHRGYDLTFGAPKSFSIAKAVAPDWLKKEMESCLYGAVEDAVNFANRNAVYSRRGKKGSDAERAKAVVCAFPHSASRADEPHDHVHTLWANACVRDDGTTGTFFGKVMPKEDGKPRQAWNPIIDYKYAIGSVMQMSFATRLKDIGFEVEKDPDNDFAFRLKHISKEAEKFYSTRAGEVETEKKRVGLAKGKVSYIAAVSTAREKGDINRRELYESCAKELAQFGITPELVEGLAKSAPTQAVNHHQAISEAIQAAHLSLTEANSTFCEARLFEKSANNLVASGIKLTDFEKAMSNALSEGQLIHVGTEKLQKVLTNQRTVEMEQLAADSIERAIGDKSHTVSEQTLNDAIENTEVNRQLTFNDEYRDALSYLTTGRTKSGQQAGAVRVLTGDAGSGKTTLLGTAKIAFEAQGYRVVGSSLTNQATEKLEKETGIESHSVAKWCWDFARQGLIERINPKHHARMFGRAAMGFETWQQDPNLKLDAKTVLVVDEATLTDTPQLYDLQIQAEQAGSLIILAKDDKQCQAIGHGGAAQLADRMTEGVRLTGNFRQRHEEDRKLVADAAGGKSLLTLESLVSRNKLHVSDTVDSASSRLVDDWAQKGVRAPEKNKIFVGKNVDRLAINKKCQEKRIHAAKTFFGIGFTNFEGQKIYAGDVIQFRDNLLLQKTKGHDFVDRIKTELKRINPLKNNPTEEINNGQYGTVLSINPFKKTFRVKVDDGRNVTVPMDVVDENARSLMGEANRTLVRNKFKTRQTKIALGYATTTHIGQGSDYENVFLLTSGAMQDQELTYTQLSRHKESVQMYTTGIEAGRELSIRSKLNDSLGVGIEALNRELAEAKRIPGDRLQDSPLAKSMATSRKKEFAIQEATVRAEERKHTDRKIS